MLCFFILFLFFFNSFFPSGSFILPLSYFCDFLVEPNHSQCRDVFIHPTAGYRIFKLSEAQLEQFIDFALNNRAQPSNDAPCPLPFRAEKYAQRIEQTESMGLHIFRNKYERRPRRFTSDGIRTNYRSMRRLDDFPELVDFLEKRNRTGSGSGQGQD